MSPQLKNKIEDIVNVFESGSTNCSGVGRNSWKMDFTGAVIFRGGMACISKSQKFFNQNFIKPSNCCYAKNN